MKKRKLWVKLLGIGMAAVLTAGSLAGCGGREEPLTTEIQSGESEPEESPSQTETPEETTGQADVEEAVNVPRFAPEEYPRVDGSTATLPLSIALYRQSTGVSRAEAEAAVLHTKTDNSYQDLMYGIKDLLLVYEASPKTKEMMKEKKDPLLIKPIGKDALVFLANKGNLVESLSEEQLVDIYTGKIKTWDQAGGKRQPIEAFQRPENSGSQTMMEKLVMRDREMEKAPTRKVIGDMGELIEGVAAYNNSQNALGYSVYFYARNMYAKPELKFMAVNGVMPSNSTIKSGEYPYVNEFYAVIRKDAPEDSPARKLFDWLTTQDGQEFIESQGYVGVSETENLEPEEKTAVNQVKTVDLNLELEEDQRIVIPGTIIENGENGVFLDRHMRQEPMPEGVTVAGSQISQISMGKPVPAIDTRTGLKGIYSFEQGKWLIEPEYSSFYYDYENHYYRSFSEEWQAAWYDEDLQLLYQGNGEVCGDYIWKAVDENHYSIMKRDGQPARDLDLSKKKGFYYAYPSYGRMIAGYESEFEIYDPDGTIIFQKSDLPEEYLESDDISMSAQSEDGKCLEFYCSQGDSTVVSVFQLEQQKLLLDREESGGLQLIGGDWYCWTTKNGVKYYYDTDGKQVMLKNGQPATLVVGKGWVGNEPEAGTVFLENKNRDETYTFRHGYSRISDIQNIGGSYFSLTEDGDSYILYHEGEEIARKYFLYHWEVNDYTIVGSYEIEGEKQISMPQLILDRNGELVMQTVAGEDVLYVGPNYVVTRRGAYIYLCDWEGNCGYYALRGFLTDD